MEFTIWLIFIVSTLLFLITLALVNCAELPEDQTPEGKKIITPLPKGLELVFTLILFTFILLLFS